MAATWYEGLPENGFVSDADKQYMLEISRIRKALATGMGFEEAAVAVEEQNEELRRSILEDTLKILIAEEHFNKGFSIEHLSKILKLPETKIESAKSSMLEEIVEDMSMRQYMLELDPNDPGRTDA